MTQCTESQKKKENSIGITTILLIKHATYFVEQGKNISHVHNKFSTIADENLFVQPKFLK